MHRFCPQRSRPISLCEALDRVINTGIVALGEVTLSVADVDLIYLSLQLVVTSIESGRQLAPSSVRPEHAPDSRPGPRALPREEGPTSDPATRPPGVAAPSLSAGQNGLLPSGALGQETAPPKGPRNGLGQLVLTLIKVLHELLERQALRRIEGGSLTQAQIERLGVTLMNQTQEIERLRKELGLQEADLNLDLGPLGKLL